MSDKTVDEVTEETAVVHGRAYELYKRLRKNEDESLQDYVLRLIQEDNARDLFQYQMVPIGYTQGKYNELSYTPEEHSAFSAIVRRRNRAIPPNNTTGIKGVSLHKASGKYQAVMRTKKKLKHIGLFKCKTAAARTYDAHIRRAYSYLVDTNRDLGYFDRDDICQGCEENNKFRP